jgi:ferredoxin-NADP reductase
LSPGRTPVVWLGAIVRETRDESTHARTLKLDVPGWPGHTAGQHVDVRLTGEDGYQAQRSYSIASAPESPGLELTVERLDDGEVSPYLTQEVRAGDEFELRGPIGGPFTWRTEQGGPLLLIAGGSGLVPLMAMLRHRAAAQSRVEARLLVSAGNWEDVFYRDELSALGEQPELHVRYTLTRSRPAGWTGWRRRVDPEMLVELGPGAAEAPRAFVCGPTAFVESVADQLVALGHSPNTIHTERFGPSGQ